MTAAENVRNDSAVDTKMMRAMRAVAVFTMMRKARGPARDLEHTLTPAS